MFSIVKYHQQDLITISLGTQSSHIYVECVGHTYTWGVIVECCVCRMVGLINQIDLFNSVCKETDTCIYHFFGVGACMERSPLVCPNQLCELFVLVKKCKGGVISFFGIITFLCTEIFYQKIKAFGVDSNFVLCETYKKWRVQNFEFWNKVMCTFPKNYQNSKFYYIHMSFQLTYNQYHTKIMV